MLADHGFEFAEQLALDVEILDDRLDDDVATGQFAGVARIADARERGVRVGFLELALRGELRRACPTDTARAAASAFGFVS